MSNIIDNTADWANVVDDHENTSDEHSEVEASTEAAAPVESKKKVKPTQLSGQANLTLNKLSEDVEEGNDDGFTQVTKPRLTANQKRRNAEKKAKAEIAGPTAAPKPKKEAVMTTFQPKEYYFFPVEEVTNRYVKEHNELYNKNVGLVYDQLTDCLSITTTSEKKMVQAGEDFQAVSIIWADVQNVDKTIFEPVIEFIEAGRIDATTANKTETLREFASNIWKVYNKSFKYMESRFFETMPEYMRKMFSMYVNLDEIDKSKTTSYASVAAKINPFEDDKLKPVVHPRSPNFALPTVQFGYTHDSDCIGTAYICKSDQSPNQNMLKFSCELINRVTKERTTVSDQIPFPKFDPVGARDSCTCHGPNGCTCDGYSPGGSAKRVQFTSQTLGTLMFRMGSAIAAGVSSAIVRRNAAK